MHVSSPFFLALAIGLVLDPARREAHADASDPPPWKQFLSWLPDDTETVFVAQHAIRVSDVGPSFFEYDKVVRFLPTGPMFELQKGLFRTALGGQKIVCAVEGSRNFTFPIGDFGLGLMLYEGAHLVQFEPAAQESVRKAFEVCQKKAERTIELAGNRVAVFTVKEKTGSWTYLVVQPKPGLLTVATDQAYLRDTLTRLAGTVGKRALPDDLPEWNQVDLTADVWAVRHYRKDAAEKDPTSPLMGKPTAFMPDNSATGFVFWCNVDSDKIAHVRYLSGSKDAIEIVRKQWNRPSQKLTPEIKQSGPDCVEVVGKITRDQSGQMWALSVMMYLGHAIFL